MSFFLLLVFSVFCSIWIAKYVWRRRWLYYYGSKLDGPFAFPFIGNGYQFIGGPEYILKKLMEIFEKYEPISRLWFGQDLYIICSNPEDIEIILNNSLQKGSFYKFGLPALGEGILLVQSLDSWKKHRRIISFTFSQKILDSFLQVFNKYSQILVQNLESHCGGDYVDMLHIFTDCTVNMICETTMGTEINNIKERKHYAHWILEMEQFVTYRFFRVWLHNEFIWSLTAMSKKFYVLCSKAWAFVREIVEIKRSITVSTIDNLEDISKKKVFLDLLIDLTDKEEKWTDKELMEEAQTMVFAGTETTAVIQSFVSIMLALHPEIQEKVHQEIVSIFGNSDRLVEPEDFAKMEYLERVIKETMRLFPITPLLARNLHEDVQLATVKLPKDSNVIIPSLYLHRKPEIWDDPLKFDPDRFLPENIVKRHRYSYIPFSMGPRDCIGKKYAMMVMKTLTSKILRKFKLVSTEYKSVEDVRLQVNVVTKAVNGWKIKLERRQNKIF